MISDVFIARPRLAAVVSIVLTLAGLLAIFALPVTQYPNVAPPTVTVSATYPGANAQAVADAVGQPLERAINGVQNMLYMSSTSTDAGTYSLTVTFAVGTDPDIDQVDVSNRVQLATSQLPEAVARQGVTVRSQSPNFLLALAFYSTNDSMSPVETGAYVSTNIATALSRVSGVGNASVIGTSDYAMRIWTKPDKMAALNIAPSDIATAIENANVSASLGQVGGAPAVPGQAVEFTVTAEGRLSTPEQFENIVVRAQPNGALVRVRDVARVELGPQDYSVNSFFNGRAAQMMQVNQAPGANALSTVKAVRQQLEQLSAHFPSGLHYATVYDATAFVSATIEEILFTLALTVVIVVAVVYVFLHDWRATLVPALAIPVSLVGTFAFLLVFGFSINVITLLAMILAIGLVVDDAILVVENIQRVMTETDTDPADAARQAMRQVTGPIISTTLVLLAVFVPTTFLPGLSGQLYKQFGVTLSTALVLSAVVALTLTPALASLLLRPPRKAWLPLRLFAHGFEKTASGYARVVSFLVRRVALALALLCCAGLIAFVSFTNLPKGLIPDEDQGAILFDVSLPDSSSLQRTTDMMKGIGNIIADTDGVENYVLAAGFSLLQSAQRASAGIGIIGLKPWGQRDRDLFQILGELSGKFSALPGAQVAAFPPPPIPGLGSVGGFSFQLLAEQGQSPTELAQVARSFVNAANGRPEIAGARTTFSADVPRIFISVDRDRAQTLGLTVADIYNTIGASLGTDFVNQFNYNGRVYQVRLQAGAGARKDADSILNLYAKNSQGRMVPLRTVIDLKTTFGPYTVPRYNLYLSAAISGNAAPGYSSGAALAALQQVADQTLPDGYSYQFSGTSLQEQQTSSSTYIAFALAFIFAYLFLVGQYESWLLPLAVILSLAVAAAGATLVLLIFGFTSNVYSQIGLVMLIGLASKNAILIVEFARDRHQEGLSITDAAVTGSRQRLRAVVMTALAFILGISPLVLASGAGAAARNVIGVTAIGGMLAATLVGILIVPSLFALVERLAEGRKGKLWGREEPAE